MTSHRVVFSSTADQYESDGITEVGWVEPSQAISSFPYRTRFVLGGITWFMELNVLPGRDLDRLHMYILKFVDGIFTPMLDMSITDGVQININDELRIYPYDVNPVFDDLYRFTKNKRLQGTYNLAVAPYI